MGWPNFIFEKLFEEVFSHSLGPEQKLDRSPSALRLEEKRGAFARDRVGPDSSAVARHDAFDDAQANARSAVRTVAVRVGWSRQLF